MTDSVERAARASGPPLPATVATKRAEIDALYAGDDVEAIATRLAAAKSELGRAAFAALGAVSPTSAKVVLAALRRASKLPSLRTCLEQEYRTSCSFLSVHDFVEGIRAAVVDKDRSPRWRPGRLEDISDDTVADILAGPAGLEPPWG